MTSKPIVKPNYSAAKWRTYLSLLIIALILEIYFLISDIPIFRSLFPSKRATSSTNPIGLLVSQKNSVRYQTPDDLVWENSVDRQVLHTMESVLTLENSKAEVALLDGTGISIGESSLIQLERTSDPRGNGKGPVRLAVKLMRGELHKSARRNLKGVLQEFPEFKEILPDPQSDLESGIQIDGAWIKYDSQAEFSIKTHSSFEKMGEKMREKKGEPQIWVESGSIEVETPTQLIQVHQNEGINLAPGKPVRVMRSPFRLISPTLEQVILFNPGGMTSIEFKWEYILEGPQDISVELEVSRDPLFTSIASGPTGMPIPLIKTQINVKADSVQKQPLGKQNPWKTPIVKKMKYTLSLPKQADTSIQGWYWRLRTLGAENIVSSVGKFWIELPRTPKSIFPKNGARLKFKEPVELIWEHIPGQTEYEIEIRQNSSHPRRLKPPPGSGELYRLKDLGLGEYQWKVRAKLEKNRTTPWSETSSFFVDPKAPPPPNQIFAPEVLPIQNKSGDSK